MSNTVENNNNVTVHYVGTLTDGTVFDSSRDKETPFTFTTGAGQVVPGFNNAVVGMIVGDTKTVTLTPDVAYGSANPNAFTVAPKAAFEEGFEFTKGNIVSGNQNGQTFQAKIEGTTDSHVVLDMNHPLAGQILTFEIEILSTKENTEITDVE
jgi:FKBP-type peptidyl-prolyl cis-trans isomerase 2